NTYVPKKRGQLVRMAPKNKGIRRTVYMGNGILVKCDKMIFVAIRPNTTPAVIVKRMKCWFFKMYEFGDESHKYPQNEYNTIANN
ncbi:13019_t:CDS:1, partial [Entrophospora sp. SA101]